MAWEGEPDMGHHLSEGYWLKTDWRGRNRGRGWGLLWVIQPLWVRAGAMAISRELKDAWGSRALGSEGSKAFVVYEAGWAPFGLLYEYTLPTQVGHGRNHSAIRVEVAEP